MTEQLEILFKNTFGNNVILATILISIIPLIELRGAIPFGMSIALWGTNALNAGWALLYAFLGSSLIAPVMTLIFMPLLQLLKKTKLFKSISTKIENNLKEKGNKIEEEAEAESHSKDQKKKYWYKVLGLFGFVAIPLPMTGVYSGSCVGVVLGLKFRDIMLANILGNLCSGIIMTIISCIFADYTIYIIYVFLALVVIFLLAGVIKKLVKRARAKKNAISTTPIVETVEHEEK